MKDKAISNTPEQDRLIKRLEDIDTSDFRYGWSLPDFKWSSSDFDFEWNPSTSDWLTEDSATAVNYILDHAERKGHASLAEMVESHISVWRGLLNVAKDQAEMRNYMDDVSYFEHELKALKDIEDACQIGQKSGKKT